ncbi:MAG: tRNA (adenosine(37)-N6)-threonylcarbamoyltransferase complex transferase subunit TsaD [Proteobacteria bacterium]|nr:tRNA (adenosine(37)-N6)-threonylcarbamoyltransferase complex transferase subunit TsaD [Pseudomonadota bacterium]
MNILGLETSCDETAAGVVEDGRRIRSNVVQTQFDLHSRYGGVVPELASRRHIEVVLPVVQEALDRAGMALDDLDGLAVTQGPGLMGALLVGLNLAKAVALASGLPLTGVNHIHGHVAAGLLDVEPADYPLAALVVSGGHTNLYQVRAPLDLKLEGQTRDDAAGEAFDKAAKLLGLGYPGGVRIDRLSEQGDPKRFDLPRPMKDQGLDFSFSGLKTALSVLVAREFPDRRIGEADLADLAASFQAAVVETLVFKTAALLDRVEVKGLLLAGGVASNRSLRRAMTELARRRGLRLLLPPPELCTDNGAMIAAAGYHSLLSGRRLDMAADAYSRWPAA